MNPNKLMILSNVLLLVLLSGAVFFNSRTAGSSAQAGQGEATMGKAAAQWEYCVITDRNLGYDNRFGKASTKLTIRYFLITGVKEELIEGTASDSSNFEAARLDAYSKAFAKLGSEGWEMVQERVDDKRPDVIYFKRPKA